VGDDEAHTYRLESALGFRGGSWDGLGPRYFGRQPGPHPSLGDIEAGASSGLMQTAMPYSLPPEILDIVIDHLHDEPTALRACCLVSKSWVPRSRTHLFAHVELTDTSVEPWMKAFPDPLNSPAHYTRTLTIHDHQLIAVVGPVVANRICTFPFHNVVHLNIHSRFIGSDGDRIPLVPFHGLSPTIRSLRLELSHARPSEALGLMCSFPLLEDFAFQDLGQWNGAEGWTPPSTSPRLTGTLELRSVIRGIGHVTHQLLDLPNGLNFTKIVLSGISSGTGFGSITDLVSGCSGTLESLDVSDYYPGEFPLLPVFCWYLTPALSPVHGNFV